MDVRLNIVSQLAGFTKKDDLAYFLEELCGMDYVHLPILVPTETLLREYQDKLVDWTTYRRRFLNLMGRRRIEQNVPRKVISGACLLCSKGKPDNCHRRLVAEYLGRRRGDIEIRHPV